MFSSGFKHEKLSTNLRLAINRLKLLEKKKTEMAIKSRKEIADYLGNGKEERARIRVEHIVREDYMVEAMEIIEMYCDLLLARMGLIQSTKELDPGLEEPIASIIWATPRLYAEVQELKVISDQLTAKYSKEFATACRTNELANVNEKLMHKMSVQAPPKPLIEKYLEEIAKCYNVPFVPEVSTDSHDEVLQAEGFLIDFNDKNKGGGGGGGGGLRPMQPLPQSANSANFTYPPGAGQAPYPPQQGAYPSYPPQQGSYPHAPPFTLPVASPPPTSNVPPQLPTLPDIPDLPSIPDSMPPGGASAGGQDVDFDDLTKRFEALKKKK